MLDTQIGFYLTKFSKSFFIIYARTDRLTNEPLQTTYSKWSVTCEHLITFAPMISKLSIEQKRIAVNMQILKRKLFTLLLNCHFFSAETALRKHKIDIENSFCTTVTGECKHWFAVARLFIQLFFYVNGNDNGNGTANNDDERKHTCLVLISRTNASYRIRHQLTWLWEHSTRVIICQGRWQAQIPNGYARLYI